MSTVVGKPISRLDGPAKVTGAARYSGDVAVARMAHAAIACATIPAGELSSLDTAHAEAAAGVIRVITYRNAPKIPQLDTPPAGQKHVPLQGPKITYEGEPIAVVVAETLEQAIHAANLIRVTYRADPFETDFRRRLDRAEEGEGYFPNDTEVGDVEAGLAAGAVAIRQTYRTADRHHNAIEPSAAVSEWRDGKLLQTGSTQGVQFTRVALAKAFGLEPADVQVKCEFVGGGFGGKGWTWPHQILCALAAREVGRPVKLVLPRSQDFTGHGYQPATEQRVELGAQRDGTLVAVRHTSVNPTSTKDDYVETCAMASRSLYATPAIASRTRVVRVDRNVGTPMRAPHEGPGLVGIEIAMDELAYELGLDPLAVRLKNYADKDPSDGRVFSAKKLRECYEEGARRFGWQRRTMAPRSMSDGTDLVGWGMASAIMQTFRNPAKARLTLRRDGSLVIEGSTQEIGTGTTTVIPQIAAEVLGLPVERVELRCGDSVLPEAPMTAGSSTTLSFGSAVQATALKLKEKLTALAQGRPVDAETYGAILAANGLEDLSVDGEWAAEADADAIGQPKAYALNSYGAVFVEVRIDRDFMIPRVTRGVVVVNAGRIVNPKTARSQLVGGFAWGLGQALFESTDMDHRLGRYLSKNLAGSLVPVNADLPLELDVAFVEEPDYRASLSGARGMGELSACGIAPAIANAVFHATGIRVRELPIRPESLLSAPPAPALRPGHG